MSPSASVLSALLVESSLQPTDLSSQSRLKRIQSKERFVDIRAGPHQSIQPPTNKFELDPSAVPIHENTEGNPVSTKPFVTATATASASAPLADAESDSDVSQSSSSTHPASSPTSPPLTYPFPPPGLSKPLSLAPEMLSPDLQPPSCTDHELEFKSDFLFTSPHTANHCASAQDGSVWSSFRMESFLGNYCHTSTNSKTLTHPLPFHNDNEDGVGTPFDLPPVKPYPRSSPPALLLPHLNRLKDSSRADEIASNLDASPSPSPQHPPSSLPFSNSPCVVSQPVNPLMAQRQRQRVFMTSWNRVRQKNRYAPAMPSFFNPIRAEAPGCAWNFLRDPACGGNVNERASARRGRDSVFEKPLVKLPLTRCRSSCDRVRQDQQSLLGWGIHAWISPSKHCRYCINDRLLKGLLAYHAFEFERVEKELRNRREQEQSLLFMCPSETEDAVDSDAVLLSFPYRTPSHGHHQCQIQNIPMDPWINYNDVNTTEIHTCSHTPCVTETARSNPDPKDTSAWSKELEKRLLASPVIRDMDDFDLEDEDMGGFDDEDLDGYYDSDEDEMEEEGYSSSGSSSPTSDECECEEDSSCGCRRIVIDDTEVKSSFIDEGDRNFGDPEKAVLMSFWEDGDLDGDDCVRVDVDKVGRIEMVDGGLGHEEKWVVDEMCVMEVQVQA